MVQGRKFGLRRERERERSDWLWTWEGLSLCWTPRCSFFFAAVFVEVRGDWWWRWRRNVSFFLSLSLHVHLSSPPFSRAHYWVNKYILKMRVSSKELVFNLEVRGGFDFYCLSEVTTKWWSQFAMPPPPPPLPSDPGDQVTSCPISVGQGHEVLGTHFFESAFRRMLFARKCRIPKLALKTGCYFVFNWKVEGNRKQGNQYRNFRARGLFGPDHASVFDSISLFVTDITMYSGFQFLCSKLLAAADASSFALKLCEVLENL